MTTLIVAVILTLSVTAGMWGHLNWGNRSQFAGPGIGLGVGVALLLACYLLGWI